MLIQFVRDAAHIAVEQGGQLVGDLLGGVVGAGADHRALGAVPHALKRGRTGVEHARFHGRVVALGGGVQQRRQLLGVVRNDGDGLAVGRALVDTRFGHRMERGFVQRAHGLVERRRVVAHAAQHVEDGFGFLVALLAP